MLPIPPRQHGKDGNPVRGVGKRPDVSGFPIKTGRRNLLIKEIELDSSAVHIRRRLVQDLAVPIASFSHIGVTVLFFDSISNIIAYRVRLASRIADNVRLCRDVDLYSIKVSETGFDLDQFIEELSLVLKLPTKYEFDPL